MDDAFALVCQLLLSNNMICSSSHPGAFDYLSTEHQHEKIDQHMARMGYRVARTHEQSTFYLSYLDASQPQLANRIKSQFRQVVNDLEPIVKWLRLAMSAGATGRPISPGEIISETELLSSIEHSSAQLQTLIDIASSRFVNSKSKEPKGMLNATINRLVEQGYFVPAGNTGTQYKATGKWSWLYEVMTFIQIHMALPEDDDQQNQMDLV